MNPIEKTLARKLDRVLFPSKLVAQEDMHKHTYTEREERTQAILKTLSEQYLLNCFFSVNYEYLLNIFDDVLTNKTNKTCEKTVMPKKVGGYQSWMN